MSCAQHAPLMQASHVGEPMEMAAVQVPPSPPASVDASDEPDEEPEVPDEEPDEEVAPLDEELDEDVPSLALPLSSELPLLLPRPPSSPLLFVVLLTVQAPKAIAASPAPSTPIKE